MENQLLRKLGRVDDKKKKETTLTQLNLKVWKFVSQGGL